MKGFLGTMKQIEQNKVKNATPYPAEELNLGLLTAKSSWCSDWDLNPRLPDLSPAC